MRNNLIGKCSYEMPFRISDLYAQRGLIQSRRTFTFNWLRLEMSLLTVGPVTTNCHYVIQCQSLNCY